MSRFLGFIFLSLTVSLLVGCSNPLGSGDSKIDEDYNPGASGALIAAGVTATFDEDTQSSAITLIYSGSSSLAAASCLISDLSNVTVAQACACASGICTVRVQGSANYYGAAGFRYRVTDQEGRLSNSASADLTIDPINDAPVLASIANQSATAGQPLVVNLNASDVDSALNCSTAFQTPTTSNAGVIPSGSIVFAGTAPNCTATITPLANQSATVTLGFVLTDGQLTSSQNFNVTVTSPPAIPTGLAVTAGVTQLDLTWTASASGVAPISYTVYRSTTSGAGYSALAACTSLSATACADSTVTPGVRYYYVVRASNVDGTSLDSNEVNAKTIPGAINNFLLTLVPATATAGASFNVTVTARDSYNNVKTDYTSAVQFSSTDPNSPTLPADYTFLAGDQGVKTFSVTLKTSGNQTITVNQVAGGLPTVTSSNIAVSAGTATQLAMITGPTNTVAGSAISTMLVRALDAYGNTATGFSGNIALAITTNPGGGTLSGATTVAAVSGSASFPGLSINKSGIGFVLTASSTGLTPFASSAFNITPGTAATIAVSSGNNQSVVAGQALGSPVVALVQDTLGNAVSGVTVNWATTSGTLGAASSITNSSGLASNTLTTSTTAQAITVTATIQGTATSVAFSETGTHGDATQIVYTTQPTGGVEQGVNLPTQPVLAIRDVNNNTVTTGVDATADVTLSLTSGTGALGGTLTVTPVAGIATFSGISVDTQGAGKVITATKASTFFSGGTTSKTVASNSFTINPPQPGAFTISSAVAGSSSVVLTWGASSNVATYTVKYGTSTGSYGTTFSSNATSPTTVTGLTNGTTYYFMVTATNVTGSTNATAEAVATPVQPPSAPTLSRTITQASRVDLSWTASTGTGPITYTLRRSTTSGSGYADVTGCVGLSSTTCNDASVTAGTTYYYIVNATNAGGTNNSNEVSATPIAAFTIGLTPGNRQIQATFSSAGATSYSLQYGTSTGSYSTTLPGATSPNTVSSLINGTTYFFMATASNAAGSVTATAEVSSTPNGPQPFNISSATPGNAQVALTWGSSTGATSYNVRYGTSSGSYGTTFATGLTGASSTVTGLTNGTTYYFMVTAVNAIGTQDAMVEFVRTPAQPTLSVVSNQIIETQASNWSSDVAFTLGGLASLTCNGTVAATSSNTSFIANGALTLSGTYPNCNLNIAVGANQTGTTTITLTATYGSATAAQNFQFQAVQCPTNFIAVLPLSPYTTSPFCVAKYEMKNVSGVATSQASGTPWVSIQRGTLATTAGGAWKACRDLGYSAGVGYDLISNAQWQTIARNLEGVGFNWSGSTVGNAGGMSRGHSDSSPNNALVAVTDDNDSCSGTGQTCSLSTWSDQRRVQRLSSGSYIWDFAGNVWEWVQDNSSTKYGADLFISTMTTANRPTTGTIGGVLNNANYHFGPAGDYTALSSSPYGGLGYGWLNYSAGAILRGGYWGYGVHTGVFTASLAVGPSNTDAGVGFRCVWSP